MRVVEMRSGEITRVRLSVHRSKGANLRLCEFHKHVISLTARLKCR